MIFLSQPGCYKPNSLLPGILKIFPARENLVSDIPAENRVKWITFFYSVPLSGRSFWPDINSLLLKQFQCVNLFIFRYILQVVEHAGWSPTESDNSKKVLTSKDDNFFQKVCAQPCGAFRPRRSSCDGDL